MRTTLDIDEDILAATKELARRQRLSMGRVVSQLLRQGLAGQGLPVANADSAQASAFPVTGFRPFPARQLVTNDQIDALREAEGI